ncbi:response regulator [Kribbella sp. CA-293567]|uniref:response regulator n=1 Tax=Kribbella sp. CA-293567 TaxID=3002436 RepID=UPI0022DDC4CA|nr:response regulator [Kribbella sp. CA-293567]WBQ04575.1 response regulator [Kribbella sp. CA-293567]
MPELRVLVVEDDPVAAEAHRVYVDRLPGFVCVGLAGTAARALHLLSGGEIDLVLLDMNLPDGHGLDVVRRMRAAGNQTDVVAVTAAREVAAVQAAARIGVVQYVLKPFAFETLRDRLSAYSRQRRAAEAGQVVADQDEVDRLLHPATSSSVPKGLAGSVLDRVVTLLGDREGWTAEEVAASIGTSRITARRYLEHLADQGQALRTQRYDGRSGRPKVEYSWVSES